MRLTDKEYEELLARRTETMKDVSRQLNITVPRNVRKLAQDTIPKGCHPLTVVKPRTKKAATPKQPNKTEAECGRILAREFPHATIRYEAITLVMANGHRYTPDWVVQDSFGIVLVEVKARGKNGFRHPSYQRAKLAYDQCQQDFPTFSYRWAEKCGGKWEIS